MFFLLYFVLLIFFAIYSYALVDPNLTLIQSDIWVGFRNSLVDLGYYHRDASWLLYLVGVVLLFVFSYFFTKNFKKFDPLRIAILVGLVSLISYPFLTHDLFNYMFDAKIVTWYHQNPYLFKALDFPQDQWLRFMHWTHRTYPYGPVFLLITLVPSFLSLGKFLLSFLLFKVTWLVFYALSVYCLKKIDKRSAILFATNPLVIIEGLINMHNDLVAVSLGIIGVYFIFKQREILGRFFILASAGIKYVTAPLILTSGRNKVFQFLAFAGVAAILIYMSLWVGIQPWYFINLFVFHQMVRSFIQLIVTEDELNSGMWIL